MLKLLVVVAVFLSLSTFASRTTAESTVQIGALLPLSGALASYGENSHAALLDAVAQINAKGGRQVELVVEDTETEPAISLEKLKRLHGRGIKVVIGPYASSQVRASKAYADEHGILLLSPLSTAQTLTIAGDNILRFTPDDEQEGVAVATLARADGIDVMATITRDDDGNRGLQSAMRPAFAALGGTVLPTIVYAMNEGDFTDEVQTLADRINQEKAAGRRVGVYLSAFGEVTSLFTAASAADPVLQSVKWYGSNSVALSQDLIEDETAAAFAEATIYPNPILGLSEDQRHLWGPVNERLTRVLGHQPDTFALAAYDALDVAYEVMREYGSEEIEFIRHKIESVAAEHIGLTGPTVLNNAGDRAVRIYDFWSVCRKPDGYTWVRSATFGSDGQARSILDAC